MPYLRSLKAVTPDQAPAARSFGSGPRAGRPYQEAWSTERAISEAYEKVTWVWRCIDARAMNQARLPMVFRQGDAHKGELVDAHPLYPLLNSAPNPYEDSFAFRYRLSSQLLLSKKGVFLEVVRDRVGRIVELYLLPPTRTAPIPSARGFIDGYAVNVNSGDEEHLDPDRVIWIRKPHPTDVYSGTTALQALGLSVDIDWLARLYNRNFVRNDGRPGGILSVQGDMDDDVEQELKARFGGSPSGAGRISVINAEEVSFVDTAISPRDAQYAEMRKLSKEEILIGLGTPESILGNASGRTWDNAEVEQTVFWRETMQGDLDLMARPLDRLDPDPNLYLAFDLSSVEVLKRDEMKRNDFHLKEVQAGVISVDEYRDATGRGPLDKGAVLAPVRALPAPAAEGEKSLPLPTAWA